MASTLGKQGKNRGKSSQAKIEFTPAKPSGEATANANIAAEEASETTAKNEDPKPILAAIKELKSDFCNRFDGVLVAIEGVRKEVGECFERVKGAETRISEAEDTVANLAAKVRSLEHINKEMTDKIDDLEARSRRLNLRLVNLPEGAEGSDACSFLEAWIPEALGITTRLTIERAHRVGPRRDTDASPRTLILKFLSDRDKMLVLKELRNKKEVLYKDRAVRFYPDLAAGIHKKHKAFDSVRQKLRNIGIRNGIRFPARLLLTYKGNTRAFDKPADVENFIKSIQEEEKQTE